MDFQKQVYAKTPIGDEAVRQSTRVVQRNLRMVLVQVDGKLTVEELSAKIGNPRLVEKALRELEAGGFVTPTLLAPKVWEDSKRQAERTQSQNAFSSFSAFDPAALAPGVQPAASHASSFSSFGKPILPAAGGLAIATAAAREPIDDEGEEPQVAGLPFARLLSRGLLLLSVVVLLLALFYPYDRFAPELSAAAERYLQTKVRIGGVGVAVWPRPALVLTGVRLGETDDFSIDTVRIVSPFSLIGSGVHRLERLDVAGVKVSADALASFSLSRQPLPTQEIDIARIVVERFSVSAGSLSLHELSGNIGLQGGKIEQADFQSTDHSLRIAMKPGVEGPTLEIEAFGWQPFEDAVKFDLLQAEALLLPGQLIVRRFDSRLLGGVARGSWVLDWRSGLSMEGSAGLTGMDARRVTAAFVPALRLDGELSGSMRLRSSGSGRENLFDNLDVALETDIVRGMLYGIDLGEAARRGQGADVRAGTTKFDRLRASLSITPRQVSGRNVQIGAGMFSAQGQFQAVSGASVDGSALLSVSSSVSSLKLPVRIFGRLPDLTVTSRN